MASDFLPFSQLPGLDPGARRRGYEYPQDVPIEELIFVPENAEYYAAYGAAIYGLHEPADVGLYPGLDPLKEFIAHGRSAHLGASAGAGLVKDAAELEAFRKEYAIPKFVSATFEPGQKVRGVIGLDGGSTSSKAVADVAEGLERLDSPPFINIKSRGGNRDPDLPCTGALLRRRGLPTGHRSR